MTVTQQNLISTFGDACDLGNAALFVGAGLSRAAGLPDWAELLEEPCTESDIPREASTDLPLLAEYVLTAGTYSRDRLVDHLLQETAGIGIPPTGTHRALARLPVSQIWTTNYDSFLERASTDAVVIANDNDVANIGAARKSILKMHGSISSSAPPTWESSPVITRSDYERYELDHVRLWSLLNSAYLSKTFLFLGFGFQDPNIEILQRLSRLQGTATTNRHITIMRRPDDTDPDLQRLHDLRCGDLERSGIKVHEILEHSELEAIATALVRRTRRPRMFISGSLPKESDNDDFIAHCQNIAEEVVDEKGWELCSLGGPAGWHICSHIAGIKKTEHSYDPSKLVFMHRDKDGPAPEFSQRVGTAVYTDLDRESLVRGLLDDSRAMLVVGGKDRTNEEITWATDLGLGVVPLPLTGGAALEYWEKYRDNPPTLGGQEVSRDQWERLGSSNKPAATRAAMQLLKTAMYSVI